MIRHPRAPPMGAPSCISAGFTMMIVAGFGHHLANHAPRPLRAGCHDPDSELVVRVARKGVLRKHGHRLDAGYSRAMLHYMMDSFGHDRVPYPLLGGVG